MRVCVFCGSNAGHRAAYAAAAEALGRTLAERRIGLVYGGDSVGLMGRVADAALAAGGHVTGILPQRLADKELAHTGLSDLHIVGSMHERKAMMADLSDAFIALPGGAGTLEEAFEIWTWGQLGLHAKPLGLLDVEGYFGRLSGFLDHMVDEGFVQPAHRAMLLIEPEPEALLARFAAYEAPTVTKWLDRASR